MNSFQVELFFRPKKQIKYLQRQSWPSVAPLFPVIVGTNISKSVNVDWKYAEKKTNLFHYPQNQKLELNLFMELNFMDDDESSYIKEPEFWKKCNNYNSNVDILEEHFVENRNAIVVLEGPCNVGKSRFIKDFITRYKIFPIQEICPLTRQSKQFSSENNCALMVFDQYDLIWRSSWISSLEKWLKNESHRFFVFFTCNNFRPLKFNRPFLHLIFESEESENSSIYSNEEQMFCNTDVPYECIYYDGGEQYIMPKIPFHIFFPEIACYRSNDWLLDYLPCLKRIEDHYEHFQPKRKSGRKARRFINFWDKIIPFLSFQ